MAEQPRPPEGHRSLTTAQAREVAALAQAPGISAMTFGLGSDGYTCSTGDVWVMTAANHYVWIDPDGKRRPGLG